MQRSMHPVMGEGGLNAPLTFDQTRKESCRGPPGSLACTRILTGGVCKGAKSRIANLVKFPGAMRIYPGLLLFSVSGLCKGEYVSSQHIFTHPKSPLLRS
jgi:hypothetical protein